MASDVQKDKSIDIVQSFNESSGCYFMRSFLPIAGLTRSEACIGPFLPFWILPCNIRLVKFGHVNTT